MLFTLFLSFSLANACPYDVSSIRRQLFDYNEKPSLRQEKAILVRLKSIDPTTLRTCQDWVSVTEAMEKYTQRIVNRASRGDKFALEFGFRALRFSDGAYGESLHIDLGKSVLRHPKKFLLALQREFGDSMCNPGLVGNLGEDFVDTDRHAKALATRRQALESVRDPGLQKLKAVCLKALDTE